MGALFSLNHVGAQVVAMTATFILCLTLGAERHVRHKDAGVKTHVLVGLGSCLFTLVSAYGFAPVTGADVSVDPSRVAAQIVSGIGFLGAGVIFVNNDTVRGLTTAATVWLSAAIGMACGAGMIPLAATASGFTATLEETEMTRGEHGRIMNAVMRFHGKRPTAHLIEALSGLDGVDGVECLEGGRLD